MRQKWIFIILVSVFLLLAAVILLDIKGIINIPFFGRYTESSIGIYQAHGDPLEFKPVEGIGDTVLTRFDVSDVKAEFVADPFMIQYRGIWYMFFEVMNKETSQGDIGLATSNDGLSWKYEQIIIDEPFHLSYPYVFENKDEVYIIIGTHVDGRVLFYKAVQFPLKWICMGTLIQGNFDDCSLLEYEEKYWLFANVDNRYLRLFFSDNLFNGWEEHPSSPIVENNLNISRPGGRVVKAGEKIFRYAQDDELSYGKRVWAIEIELLTTDSYRENKYDIPTLDASGKGWNSLGMHTIDPHPFGEGGLLACVDGLKKGPFFFLKKRK